MLTNKRIDMSVDKCSMCHATNVYLYTGEDASGQVFTNTLCIECEERIHLMLDEKERMQSLLRWTTGDKR